MSQPDEKDHLRDGPAMSADGRLEKRLEAMESPGFKPPEAPPLELAERGPRANRAPELQNHRPHAGPTRRAPRVVVALLALGVVLLVGFAVLRPTLADHASPDGVTEPSVLDQLTLGDREPVLIDSTPTGAKVTIGGAVVGQTPWAGDNRWTGTVRVTIDAPGYRTWEGTFEGGKSVTLNATLKK